MALLLEGMLGLTMVTIVLLAIFQLFPVADRSVNLADKTTQANYLARKLMDTQLAKEFADVNGPIDGEYQADHHTLRRGVEMSTTFVYRIDVTQLAPDVEVKDVLVTVRWKEGRGERVRDSSVKVQSAKGKLW